MGHSASRPVANGQGGTSEVQLPPTGMEIAPGRNDNDWAIDEPQGYTGPGGGKYGYQGIPTGGVPLADNGLPIDALGRYTVTVSSGGSVLSTLSDAGIDQRAGYGYLARTGQVANFDAKGMPVVQAGQSFTVDPNGFTQADARLGGALIANESSNRAELMRRAQEAAAERATAYNANYGNEGRAYPTYQGTTYDDMSWLGGRGRPMVEQPVYDMLTGLPTGMTQLVPDAGPVRDPVGNMVASAFRDPGEGLKGAVKGLVIQPVEALLRMAGTAAAYDPYQVMADPSGRNSAELADGASRIQLPGSQFSNDAQRGGAIVGTAASLAAPMTWGAIGPRATTVLREPVVLDLFGGRTSQIPGAINVDIVAQEGIRASATQLPFRAGSTDQIVASNPYLPGGSGIMDWLPGAAETLKPGGTLTINATPLNKFGQLPSAEVLDSLGLKVVRPPGPLLPDFQGNIFRYTDGGVIPPGKVGSTVLQKMGG